MTVGYTHAKNFPRTRHGCGDMTDESWEKNAENRSFRHVSHIEVDSRRPEVPPV